ncbi:flagellin [Ruegeria aquimaris]|uniref:Flagellin n=1 Tax=Ruegeria aquimaris TaxID=2984333 RepID=A0ABT3AFM7_9RHOB|nr:flagellin [Ruegeria sp. XHP0148]MCV2887479.1 flagellin [Ruegeria sp. XHP0148]
MSLNSIGDLAQNLMLRSQGTRIRMQIDTLTQELSSGQVADVTGRLRGDFSHLADMDRSLKRLHALSTAAAETGLLADATQASLETVNTAATDLSDSLLSVSLSNQAVSHTQAAVKARSALDTMISALNTSLAGRSLFAGVAEDQSPLRDADTLLSELRTAVSGQSTPADMLQAARDWFDDPAGFQAAIYTGSDQSRSPVRVSENDEIALDRRADDPVFREGLMLAAVAALANDPALSLDSTGRNAIFQAAGTGLLGTRDRLVELQAEVGDAQSRIEKARTGNSMARTSLDLARGELIGADPYETAIRLEAVQFQLESLYTTTVRNSRLTLVNFLR